MDLAVDVVELVGRRIGVTYGAVVMPGVLEEAFHRVSGLDVEALDRGPLEVDGTVEVEDLLPLVIVLGSSARVLTAVDAVDADVVAFLILELLPRLQGLTGPDRVHIVEALHRYVGLLGVSEVETDAGLEVLQKLVGGVDTSLEPLEVYAVEYTLGLLIGEGGEVFGTGVTAAGADFIFLGGSDAGELAQRVVELAVQHRKRTVVAAGCRVVRIGAGVADSSPLPAEELGSGHHTEAAVGLEPVHTELGAEGEGGFAFLTALGGDEDNTVGGTGTVSRCGGRILQNRDGLNVIGIEGREGAVLVGGRRDVTGEDGNTIDNPKRSIGGIDGTVTADTDLGDGTRLSRDTGDRDARELTGERFVHGGDGSGCERLTLDRGDRSGHRLLLLRTVGHDDSLFEDGGIRLERHVEETLSSNGNLYCLVTKEAEDQDSVLRIGDLDGVGTVCASRCTGHSTFHLYGRSCERFSRTGISHDTRHLVLGHGEGRNQY